MLVCWSTLAIISSRTAALAIKEHIQGCPPYTETAAVVAPNWPLLKLEVAILTIDSSPCSLTTEGAHGVDVCAAILVRTSIIIADAVKCGTIATDAVRS